MRGGVYAARELLVVGFVKQPKLMGFVEKIARKHIQQSVPDPELRRKVTPDYTIGCKRILPSNRWYPALGKDNVELVTDGVVRATATGVVDAAGVEREADVIVFGTGFQVTDMPVGKAVRGRGGKTLDEVWQGSPNAYLGTSIPGFPNLFMLLGPNTGLGHSSMIYMIESQIEHVIDALAEMRRHDADTVEVREDAARAFNAEIDKRLEGTVWNTGCASWYLDDTGRNATLWPDWTFRFRQRTAKFEPEQVRADHAHRSRARGGGRMSKRVIITGAAGGLGKQATEELRRQGATVVGPGPEGQTATTSWSATCATRRRWTPRSPPPSRSWAAAWTC